MFSRVLTFTGASDIEAGVRYLEDTAAPLLREQKGFRGLAASADRSGRVVGVMSLWDTEAERDSSLSALAEALRTDDPRLIQGETTCPRPAANSLAWPTQAACVLSYPGWLGDGLRTVAEVVAGFTAVCHAIDLTLGETGGVRYLLNPFDGDWTREQMIANLLPEVELELEARS